MQVAAIDQAHQLPTMCRAPQKTGGATRAGTTNDVPGNANRYVRHAHGIDKVLVNGAVVLENGSYTDARAGVII